MSNDKLAQSTAPVTSEKEKLKIKNTRKYMLDMLLMLAAPAVMAWYYYGERAVRLMALSVITAVLCELIGSKAVKGEPTIADFSAVVTGLAVAMCLSAASPWWLVCLASAFAIVVAKIPFGNADSVMFVPAAVGIAFVTICNHALVFGYPTVSSGTAVYGSSGFVAGNSIANMLMQHNSIGINIVSYIDLLVGNVPGPIGATCAVALLGALVFLCIRRPKAAVISLSYLLVCACYAFLFPRVTTGRLISVIMELFGGLLLFSALFFMTNEVIAPKRFVSRICYGLVAGLAVMLMRTFGFFEDGCVFAVLLVNAVSPAFDRYIPLTKKEKKQLYDETLATEKALAEEEQRLAEQEKQAALLRAVEEEKQRQAAEEAEKLKATQVAYKETDDEPDDDVPTLQDLSDIEVTTENENGGDSNV